MSKTGSKPGKKPTLLPRVEPVSGEIGVYWVQSSSRLNVRHRVDMLFYGGNGACGCERFEIEFKAKLEAGAKPSVYLACKHIRYVREYSAVELWPKIAREMNERDLRTLSAQRAQEIGYAKHDDQEAA